MEEYTSSFCPCNSGTDTAHKLKLLRIQPFPGAEEGCNTVQAGIQHSLHLRSIKKGEQELMAREDMIQMHTRLISNTNHSQVWNSRTGIMGPKTGKLPTRSSFKLPKEKGLCFICFNGQPSLSARHHMRDCPQKGTLLGRRVNNLMDNHRASVEAKKAAKAATKKAAVPQPPVAAAIPGTGF
jgi:hypothetical protein